MGQLFAPLTWLSDFSFVVSFCNYKASKAKVRQHSEILYFLPVKFRRGIGEVSQSKRRSIIVASGRSFKFPIYCSFGNQSAS